MTLFKYKFIFPEVKYPFNISLCTWADIELTMNSCVFINVKKFYKYCKILKGLVHPKMKIKSLITHPHAIQDIHVILSVVEKKLRFLMKAFQDFSPYNGLQWELQWVFWFKVKQSLSFIRSNAHLKLH